MLVISCTLKASCDKKIDVQLQNKTLSLRGSIFSFFTGHSWFVRPFSFLPSCKIPYLEEADVAKASYLQILKTMHKIIFVCIYTYLHMYIIYIHNICAYIYLKIYICIFVMFFCYCLQSEKRVRDLNTMLNKTVR